ncbi:MAG TPA: glycosyltransferase family 2 protein [Acidobacteriaceae bacterium]|jgi:cellulose synthase/poly-beta-1,6-N-acetylglucosamine synthase-like glycosyltransferase|nr:glycosyltransferase family 2 protein [Acidobacteriaceae bacterium]
MLSNVSVVIPALNEAESIGQVVRAVLAEAQAPGPWGEIAECIVVDNGSTDATAEIARAAGARVVESERGYGAAAHAGAMAALESSTVIVFLDGDGSDVVKQMPRVLWPVLRDEADFVVGSRLRGWRERGSMNMSQVFAAKLIGTLVRMFYGFRYTDMGPMRAIRRDALEAMQMTEMTYGWNLEMQIKAVKMGMRVKEVAVDYRRRIGGESKVSGNVRASMKAGVRILGVLWRMRKSA